MAAAVCAEAQEAAGAGIYSRLWGPATRGICTPANHRVIFAFTGGSGPSHGYADYWTDDGVYCHFGEGQLGHMQFRAGNRALRNQLTDGKDLLLFEILDRGRVRFLGEFNCESYHETEAPDTDGQPRRAIVFHLVPQGREEAETTEGFASGMSFDALRSQALDAGTNTPSRGEKNAKGSYWRRSAIVREYVLRRANGVCECCGRDAPFARANGTAYLEPHHIRRLSDGGPDDPRYVGAVCPNCHREAHYGDRAQQLNQELHRKVDELETQFDIRNLNT